MSDCGKDWHENKMDVSTWRRDETEASGRSLVVIIVTTAPGSLLPEIDAAGWIRKRPIETRFSNAMPWSQL
jgi:hypothetical protein